MSEKNSRNSAPGQAEDRSTATRQHSVRATGLEIATTANVERTSDAISKGQSCNRRQLVQQPSYLTASSVR
eukprot:1712633-Prymnesium_polylepis.1